MTTLKIEKSPFFEAVGELTERKMIFVHLVDSLSTSGLFLGKTGGLPLIIFSVLTMKISVLPYSPVCFVPQFQSPGRAIRTAAW